MTRTSALAVPDLIPSTQGTDAPRRHPAKPIWELPTAGRCGPCPRAFAHVPPNPSPSHPSQCRTCAASGRHPLPVEEHHQRAYLIVREHKEPRPGAICVRFWQTQEQAVGSAAYPYSTTEVPGAHEVFAYIAVDDPDGATVWTTDRDGVLYELEDPDVKFQSLLDRGHGRHPDFVDPSGKRVVVACPRGP